MSEKRRDSKGRILWNGELQRKDGKYEFRYTDLKGERHSVYSWKLVDTDKVPQGKRCKESLREIEKRIKRDLDDGLDARLIDRIKVNDIVIDWLDMVCPRLKMNTKTQYWSMYKTYIKDSIGPMKASEIRPSHIRKLYTSILVDRKRTFRTVAVLNVIITGAFSSAVNDGIIRKNPSIGITKELSRLNKKGKPVVALSKSQQERLLRFVRGHQKYSRWENVILALLGTGCRIGELVSLVAGDCNFEESYINIQRGVFYKNGKKQIEITTTKSESGMRIIPMFDDVRSVILEELGVESPMQISNLDEPIFKSVTGDMLLPSSVEGMMRRLKEAYNKYDEQLAAEENRRPDPIERLTPHVFRHTFCTRLCEKTSDIKIVQEIMGHADISVTMNVYNNISKDRKIERFKDFGESISEI